MVFTFFNRYKTKVNSIGNKQHTNLLYFLLYCIRIGIYKPKISISLQITKYPDPKTSEH